MKVYIFSIPVGLFLINFLLRFFIEKKFWDKIHIGALLSLQSATFIFSTFIAFKIISENKNKVCEEVGNYFVLKNLGNCNDLIIKVQEIIKPMIKSFSTSEGIIIYGCIILAVYFFLNYWELTWRAYENECTDPIRGKIKLQNREIDHLGRYTWKYKIYICFGLVLGFLTALSIPFFYFFQASENTFSQVINYFTNYIIYFLTVFPIIFLIVIGAYKLTGKVLDPPRPDWSERIQKMER